MKGIIIRVGLLAVVLVMLVAWRPNWIVKLPYGQQVVAWRNQLIENQPQLQAALTAVDEVDWAGVWASVSTQKLPSLPFSGEPKEIKVEDLVGILSQELKELPQEKAKEIKTNFCQDVVAEAQKQGEVAGAKSEIPEGENND